MIAPSTPLELLNHLLGHWNGYDWELARLTEDEVDLTHLREAVLACSKLSEKRRQTLLLRVFSQKKFREIAAILDVAPGRAQQLFHSGLRHLRSPHNLKHIRRACVGWQNCKRI